MARTRTKKPAAPVPAPLTEAEKLAKQIADLRAEANHDIEALLYKRMALDIEHYEERRARLAAELAETHASMQGKGDPRAARSLGENAIASFVFSGEGATLAWRVIRIAESKDEKPGPDGPWAHALSIVIEECKNELLRFAFRHRSTCAFSCATEEKRGEATAEFVRQHEWLLSVFTKRTEARAKLAAMGLPLVEPVQAPAQPAPGSPEAAAALGLDKPLTPADQKLIADVTAPVSTMCETCHKNPVTAPERECSYCAAMARS